MEQSTEISTSDWNTITILALLFTILGISQLVAFLSSNVITSTAIIPSTLPQEPTISLIATMIRNTVGIVLILIFISKSLIPSIRPVDKEGYEIVENPGRWTIKWYLYLIGVLYGIIFLVSSLIQLIQPQTDTSSVYDQFLSNVSIQVGFLLVAVLFAPIFEELLFRKLLMGTLQSNGYSTSYVVGFSALIFGLSHTLGDLTGGSIYTATLHLISTTSIGIVLAIVYLKTQNVIYPIILHAINNAFSSGLSLVALIALEHPILLILLIVVFIGLFVLFVYAIVKLVKNRGLIKKRTSLFLADLHFFSSIDKIQLFTGIFAGFTVLPLLIIYSSSILSVQVSLMLTIYWGLVGFISTILFVKEKY